MASPARVEEDDTESLASTITEGYDSDDSWTVRRVLAQGKDAEGETKYLIEWEGYPLDEASWEPSTHLSEESLREWEESKSRKDCGEGRGFRISQWRDAVIKRFQDKYDRHQKRNAKRAARGYKQTNPKADLDAIVAWLDTNPKDDDGSDGDGTNMLNRERLDEKQQPLSKPTSALASRPSSIETHEQRAASHDSLFSDVDNDDSILYPQPATPPRSVSSHMPAQSGIDPANERKGDRSNSIQKPPTPRRQSRETTRTGGDSGATRGPLAAERPVQVIRRKPPAPPLRSAPRGNKRIAPGKAVPSNFGNVFGGGKQRKARKNLVEKAKDPNSDPKLLKPRLANIVQKGHRDRDGMVAPTEKPKNLFALSQFTRENRAELEATEPVRSLPNQGLGAPAIGSSSQATTTVTAAARQPSDQVGEATAEPTTPNEVDLGNSTATQPAKSRRKSVRFEADPMEIDVEGSLFLPDDSQSSLVAEPKTEHLDAISNDTNPSASINTARPTNARDMSLEQYQKRPTGAIQKECQLGQDDSWTIRLMFEGLPTNETMNPWIVAFKDLPMLSFTHTCTPEDFGSQNADHMEANRRIQEELLCSGPVTSPIMIQALESLSDRLKINFQGIFYYSPVFCITVAPTQSVDWEHAGSSTQLSTSSPLRYMIFKPNCDFAASSLAPIPNLIKSDNCRMLSLPHFLKLDFSELLPSMYKRNSMRENFFLAFPRSLALEAFFVARWLRSCKVDCRISMSLYDGHWFSFKKIGNGVVILHEDVMGAIRLFPGLAQLLHSSCQNYTFWAFSREIRSVSTFPSDASEVNVSSPGDVALRRVFCSGTITLITPSFVVGHPLQAYRFIKWFFKTHAELPDRRRKLAMCARPDEWLADLIAEERRREGVEQSSARMDAVEALPKAFNLVSRLLNESDEDDGPLVFAPEVIDANDEQSLVNWFGWWATASMDQYRRFTVLGSGDVGTKQLRARVRVPTFSPGQIPDPDSARESLLRKYRETIEQDATKNLSNSEEKSMDDHSRLGTSLVSMKDELHGLAKKCPIIRGCPIVLYQYPVSYWGLDMAWHFRDYEEQTFASFASWFKWFRPLVLDRSDGLKPGKKIPLKNTHMGFFYTILGPWDSSLYPQDLAPHCRPWLALFRPKQLFQPPWTSTELLIWDIAYKGKLSLHDRIYESDLIPAQQELIHIVAQENSKKNPKLPLERVWVGGWDHAQVKSTDPVGATLEVLDTFLEDTRVWVPAPEDKLPKRGWALVAPGKNPTSPVEKTPGSDEPNQDESHPETSLGKIIFHPPRGNGKERRSKCLNRFYRQSQEAKGRGLDHFDATFVPTLEWYAVQMAEGRGFEHIKVTTWEAEFKAQGIPDA